MPDKHSPASKHHGHLLTEARASSLRYRTSVPILLDRCYAVVQLIKSNFTEDHKVEIRAPPSPSSTPTVISEAAKRQTACEVPQRSDQTPTTQESGGRRKTALTETDSDSTRPGHRGQGGQATEAGAEEPCSRGASRTTNWTPPISYGPRKTCCAGREHCPQHAPAPRAPASDDAWGAENITPWQTHPIQESIGPQRARLLDTQLQVPGNRDFMSRRAGGEGLNVEWKH